MSQTTDCGSEEKDWSELEDELLARVKLIARRIVERVKKVTEDTAPCQKLVSDDPTDEAPAIG